jgi:hypothetical protein
MKKTTNASPLALKKENVRKLTISSGLKAGYKGPTGPSSHTGNDLIP